MSDLTEAERADLEEGLRQSAAGETVSLGSFAQYADTYEEWAVAVDWGDNRRFIQYQDEESCHRFIRNPPMWFTLPDGESTLSVVRRMAATPWTRPEPVWGR